MALFADLLITAAAGVLAGALMLRIRRRAPGGGYFADSDRASGVLGVLGASFAILLGFAVLLTSQRYSSAKEHAAEEASAVAQMFESAQLLPHADADALGALEVCYARAVIHDEWPLLAKDGQSRLVEDWEIRLRSRTDQVHPRTPLALDGFKSWLEASAIRETERRDRVVEAEHVVPPIMWVLLGVGGVLLIVFVLFYADADERRRTQALMAGGVTALVAASILGVLFLNAPFENRTGSIRPRAMEHTLALIERERAALHQHSPTPCDEKGDLAA